jgi:Skp family chaperone for outer membrane proteins
MTTRPTTNTFALLLAAGLAAAATLTVTASSELSPGPAPAPVQAKSGVAVVNLERLMEKLDEVKALNDELKISFDERQKQLTELSERVKSLEAEVKLLPAEDKGRRLKYAEYLETLQIANARKEIYQRLIDLDKGDLIRRMYNKMQQSVGAFAAKEGFEMVVLDDRGIELPEQGTQDQMNAAIQAKRVLFAADALDVTDRVANWMNTEYASPKR